MEQIETTELIRTSQRHKARYPLYVLPLAERTAPICQIANKEIIEMKKLAFIMAALLTMSLSSCAQNNQNENQNQNENLGQKPTDELMVLADIAENAK